MSVVLTVIRFEIDDKCNQIPNLKYEASHLGSYHEKSLSYAEVAATGVTEARRYSDTNKFRGQRIYNHISVETYNSSVDILDANMAAKYKPEFPTQTYTTHKSDSAALTTISAALKQKLDSSDTDQTQDTVGATAATPVTDDTNDTDDEAATPRPGSAKRGKSFSPMCDAGTFLFFSGNPSVETTEGIIHLYKRDELNRDDMPCSEMTRDDTPRSEMLCMLAIPTTLTSQDLLQFVAPVEAWIEHMKIIRDGSPNQYMMLVKFRSQKYGDDFYKHFNGKPFNSIEPDICHLIYVVKVETAKSSEGAGLPVPGLTELPVCPVCLERMDESVNSILTILCNHSFHGACLAQWGDTSCPVCRYVQTPEPLPDNRCSECTSQESLWICLICGHVGCGRYVGGHAYSHFEETCHTYAMQLDNNSVWDYTGDNYVHRLVQNKTDGKLVQVDEGGNVVEEEKLDSINLEYTYLLTSQLESQRHYFEEKMEHIEKQAFKQLEEVEIGNKKALEECKRLEKLSSTASKEKHLAEKKSQQAQTRLTKLQSELVEEQALNKSLQQNQSQWQGRVEQLETRLHQKDKEIADLQEQLRDIMFYVDAQQKLANTTEVSQAEIQASQVVVSPAAGNATRKQRKKGR